MPIYEYECGKCRNRFEKRQRFSDEPIADCPKCNSKSRRVMVPAPVIFKGSGFYVNDYPSKNRGGETSPSPAKG
jgi:putative FmdB family regulatory protein